MFFLLDIYQNIIIKVLGRSKIAQDRDSVGNKLFRVIVVGKVNILTLIFYVFKKLVLVKPGIVGTVKVLLGNFEKAFRLFKQDIKRQARMTNRSICAQNMLDPRDHAFIGVFLDIHVARYGIRLVKIKLYRIAA